MTEADVLALLRTHGAIIVDDHIVYTSGRHGPAYVNKDALYPHTRSVVELCMAMTGFWTASPIDVVVAPAVGGVILSTYIAHTLSIFRGRQVLGVYSEKETLAVPHPEGLGRKCFVETGDFVLKRAYDRLVVDRNVLVVEDVLTTGGSVRKVVEAVRAVGGNVIGVSALCNRGGVTAKDVGDVPMLKSLVNVSFESWAATEAEPCPLCQADVPINTTVGKGAEFLARRT